MLGETVCEQNPSYLHTNLTGDNAAQLLKREMPLFIRAAHAAGGTTPRPDPSHSQGTATATKQTVLSILNDNHISRGNNSALST